MSDDQYRAVCGAWAEVLEARQIASQPGLLLKLTILRADDAFLGARIDQQDATGAPVRSAEAHMALMDRPPGTRLPHASLTRFLNRLMDDAGVPKAN